MSVELRIRVEGECTCGIPYPIGENPDTCNHVVECDWGVIASPRPVFCCNNAEVEPLMLIVRAAADEMAVTGSQMHMCGALVTAECRDGRMFVTATRDDGKQWVWECFDAHWADGAPSVPLYIGRWPD